MVKHLNTYIKAILLVILLFAFLPIQTYASQVTSSLTIGPNDQVPEVLSSNISHDIIAYKGIQNPGYTTIKFKTNKPVVAKLQVSGTTASTEVVLSKWLKMKSDYEVSFVPMNYEKAYYEEEYEALPPGTYSVSVNITDDKYNSSTIGLGTVKIVKESKEQPLVEVLDIKITNEVKDKHIAPEMLFKYRVNRPAYVEAPVFDNYMNDYLHGESTQVDALPVKNYVAAPGVYEVKWDLKPPRNILRNNQGTFSLQNNDKVILPPNKYKIFFRAEEASIKDYATQVLSSKINDGEEINISVSLNKNNTEIKLLDGWTPPDTTDQSSIAPEFSDIQNNWAKDDISFLSYKKIVNGVGNNKFSPNSTITRAEFLTMIVKTLNLAADPKSDSVFIDIKPGAWYYDNVEAALQVGLITGFADNTFRADKFISREEMTAIAFRAFSLKMAEQVDMQTNMQLILDNYTDQAKISFWARNSVALATQFNLVKGGADKQFDPDGLSTRAEGAAVVRRLYNDISRYF